MCFLLLAAAFFGLGLYNRTQNPMLAIVAALVVYWLLRFFLALAIVSDLLATQTTPAFPRYSRTDEEDYLRAL